MDLLKKISYNLTSAYMTWVANVCVCVCGQLPKKIRAPRKREMNFYKTKDKCYF